MRIPLSLRFLRDLNILSSFAALEWGEFFGDERWLATADWLASSAWLATVVNWLTNLGTKSDALVNWLTTESEFSTSFKSFSSTRLRRVCSHSGSATGGRLDGGITEF